jgi:hypothetical protein
MPEDGGAAASWARLVVGTNATSATIAMHSSLRIDFPLRSVKRPADALLISAFAPIPIGKQKNETKGSKFTLNVP